MDWMREQRERQAKEREARRREQVRVENAAASLLPKEETGVPGVSEPTEDGVGEAPAGMAFDAKFGKALNETWDAAAGKHGSQEEFDRARAAPKVKGPGRPRKNSENSEQVATYVTLDEKSAMEEAALEAGMTLSSWARRVLKGALGK